MRLPLLEQQRIQAQQQADQEVRQTFERIAHYEQEMQETEPDYFEAVDWIREQRTETLYDAGYTDDEVQRQLLHDVYDLVKSGEQAGINPARLLYMQCLEAGFVPSGNAGQEQSATDGGDQAKQRINTLNKAQKNAQGVTNTGEAQAGQLTLKAAAAMNENDFSKLDVDEVERLLSGWMNERELVEGLRDPAWRLSNLYWIVDKRGRRVLFKPNPPQADFLKNTLKGGISFSRRDSSGFRHSPVSSLSTSVFFYNDQAALVVAHTRDDAEKLFASKILYAWRNLPENIRARRPTSHQTQSLIRWQHGSTIQVSNSGRSGSFTRVHVSEFGKLCARFPDRAREVVTGTFPAAGKNPITIESTAEGQEGYFYQFYEQAIRGEGQFKLHFFPWWRDDNYRVTADHNAVTEPHRLYFDKLKHSSTRSTCHRNSNHGGSNKSWCSVAT